MMILLKIFIAVVLFLIIKDFIFNRIYCHKYLKSKIEKKLPKIHELKEIQKKLSPGTNYYKGIIKVDKIPLIIDVQNKSEQIIISIFAYPKFNFDNETNYNINSLVGMQISYIDRFTFFPSSTKLNYMITTFLNKYRSFDLILDSDKLMQIDNLLDDLYYEEFLGHK